MSNFASFKKNSKKSTIAELQKKIEEASGEKVNYSDDRFWYPQRDKGTGRGEAVIRFLPVREDDFVEEGGKTHSVNGIPWVKTYSHSWQNPKSGKWYIEECPTTIGLPCPMCEKNSELWNTGDTAKQNLVRDRKRRLQYTSNVLVVSDPANPENEGKVFLFKYGKKIHDMIDKKINPEYSSQKPVNVFDMWEGANFALRIGKKDGYTNYDSSEFLPASPAGDGSDSNLEEIYNSLYKLSEFIAPSRFKSHEELSKRLEFVMGNDSPKVKPAAESMSGSDGDYDSVEDDDDDDLSDTTQSDFFRKLAGEEV